jgi:hypothetical protein
MGEGPAVAGLEEEDLGGEACDGKGKRALILDIR